MQCYCTYARVRSRFRVKSCLWNDQMAWKLCLSVCMVDARFLVIEFPRSITQSKLPKGQFCLKFIKNVKLEGFYVTWFGLSEKLLKGWLGSRLGILVVKCPTCGLKVVGLSPSPTTFFSPVSINLKIVSQGIYTCSNGRPHSVHHKFLCMDPKYFIIFTRFIFRCFLKCNIMRWPNLY